MAEIIQKQSKQINKIQYDEIYLIHKCGSQSSVLFLILKLI